MEPSYILHRKVYKETSLLLDIFTLNSGRLSVVAKGAYKAKSSRGAQLQVFQPLLFDWAGKGSLYTLTKVEAPRASFVLRGERLYAGYYVNELFLRLLAESDPHEFLFEHYATVLAALASDDGLRPLLRRCELILLHELGQLPALGLDWRGDAIDTSCHYYLSDENLFVPTASEKGGAADMLNGHELSALARLLDDALRGDWESTPKEVLAMCGATRPRLLLKTLLDRALGGRPLRSREMMRDFLSLKPSNVRVE